MSAIANPAVLAASHGYRRLLARRVCLLLVIGCALLGSVLLDLSTGSSGMGLGQLLQGLLHPQTLDVTDRVIIWNVRLPYALMAVLVGAALSLAGAEMQAILNNPLASPFTLGVSSAAALGASLVIVFPLSSALLSRDSLVALAAFVFACASMFLLHGMSRLRGPGSRPWCCSVLPWCSVATPWWRCCSYWPPKMCCSNWCSGAWAASHGPIGTNWAFLPWCWG
jgi:ABC-type Fe3+-siderophore transport system, permease component